VVSSGFTFTNAEHIQLLRQKSKNKHITINNNYNNNTIQSHHTVVTRAVLGRQNTSEQRPANMVVANFIVISNGQGCTLNGTAVAAVFIDQ